MTNKYKYLVPAAESNEDTITAQTVVDIPATFHRTNSIPLDISSIIVLSESEPYESLADLSDAAWEIVVEAAKKPSAYPGQHITVLGTVKEEVWENGTKELKPVGKAISFILQPSNHSHRDDLLDEDNDRTPDSHITVAQELAYKSYVDEVNVQLREQIGNLRYIMNFYGAFPNFEAANNAVNDTTDTAHFGIAIKPGDVIVITGGPQNENGTDRYENGKLVGGKPGMEYVCTGFTDEDPSKPVWVELGFGSQVAYFLGGNEGLTLPDICPGIGNKKPKTALEYIQKADKALADFIGGLYTEDNTFKLPETMPGGSKTNIYTILDYIQKSDNIIANFIRPGNDSSELKVPDTLPNGNTPNAETVVEYIQESDNAIVGLLEAEEAARIAADRAEQVRTTNTDASIIAGASFVRTDDNKLQWKSETQTLTYNKAVATISEEGQEYVKIEEESITSCDGGTYYLVARKKEGSRTNFAEFKVEGTTKIPLRELALFGQEFSSDSSEGCFHIFDSLCYVNEDYSLKEDEALGTIITTISTDVSENGNTGWWCISNGTRTVPVDSLLQIMSNIANVRDTLKTVQEEVITIEHEQDSEDTCLCINLNTFTTNINSSY